MSKKTISVEVSDGTYDVGCLLAEIIGKVKKHKAEGDKPIQILMETVTEEFSKILAVIPEAGQVPGEYTEDHKAFMRACGNAGAEVAIALAEPVLVAPAAVPPTA